MTMMLRKIVGSVFFFFFNDTATTEIYTLSLHDALPICFSSGTSLAMRFRLRGAGVPTIGVRDAARALMLNRDDSMAPWPDCARISRPQVPAREKVTCVT